MDGAVRLSGDVRGDGAGHELPDPAAGDYNGDTRADILWRNIVQGDVWVWLMDGTARLSETYVATVPDTGYQIVTVK